MSISRSKKATTFLISMVLSMMSGLIGSLMGIGLISLRSKFLLGYYYETRYWLTNGVIFAIGITLLYVAFRFSYSKLKGIKYFDRHTATYSLIGQIVGIFGGSSALVAVFDLIRGFLRCTLGWWGL